MKFATNFSEVEDEFFRSLEEIFVKFRTDFREV